MVRRDVMDRFADKKSLIESGMLLYGGLALQFKTMYILGMALNRQQMLTFHYDKPPVDGWF